MNCEHMRTLMHQMLDDSDSFDNSDKIGEFEQMVDAHTKSCADCHVYWQQTQQIERELASLPLEEPPVDFSNFNWEMLAQTDTLSQISDENRSLVERSKLKWQTAALVVLALCTLIPTAIASILIIPNWAPLFLQIINQGAERSVEIIKDALQWIFLWNTIWRSSVSFVRAHTIEILLIVSLSISCLLYLLKTREVQTSTN